ncbi:MAG: hypothetical protein CEO12_449 [Parcubacteria group bacterium Gr01-1014_46]|nr:MAG: hypothetical protein CEO12_449 [Parcubacteria group bacterium Gr01-1014_46]
MNKGTTLIEVIIYIALFSILLTGSFMSAMGLVDSNSKTRVSITVQDEGNFVMRKINWLITNLDPTSPPTVTGSGCSQILTVRKINYSLNPIVLRLNSNILEISQGGGVFVPITTINVKVTCLEAEIISTNELPLGVSATTTINGTDFAITKYLRK